MKKFFLLILVLKCSWAVAQENNQVSENSLKPGPSIKDNSEEYFTDKLAPLNKVPLVLTWQIDSSADAYELQISRHHDFSHSEVFVTKNPQMHIAVFHGSKYFWRVKSLKQNQPASEYSKRYNFFAYYVGPIVIDEVNKPEDIVSQEQPRETAAVESAEIKQEVEITKPWIEKTDWKFDLGTYSGYYIMNQSFPGQAVADFSAIHGFSVFLKAGVVLNNQYGININVDRASGTFANNSLLTGSTNYTYQKIDLDFNYKYQLDEKIFGMTPDLNLILGFEYLTTPYVQSNFTSVGTTFRSVLSFADLNITNAYLGANLVLDKNEKWSYHGTLKYLVPLSGSTATGKFKFTPNLVFDTELGPVYKWTESMHLGMFWQLQYRNYQGTFDNGFSTYDGYLRSIISNIDLRFGLDF